MEKVFISLLNTSITAGYLVIAVMLLRPLLKKAPKYIRCILWGLVGLRLILPFSFESVLSLIPSAETVPPEIVTSPAPTIRSGFSLINSTVNPILSHSMAPVPEYSVNPMQVVMGIAWNVWLLGVMAMVLYSVVSYLLLKHKLREAVKDNDNVWLCDRVQSPFLLGLFRPRIYLPSNLQEADRPYVLAHENAHICRRDHWWKPLGFFLLTVYWFNPLMWVAYIFLCRDIEFACDEKVIQALGSDCKKSYSEALIHCSVPRKMISACPVAFGEDGVKGRIKSVLSYKKPAFWIILIAVILCIVVAVCFLTNPYSDTDVMGNRFETGNCIYSNVISKEKETQSNQLVFDFHTNREVYKEAPATQREYLGVLFNSNYTVEMLNDKLRSQSADSTISLGRIKDTYEIQDASGQLKYVFFQKYNGKVIMASFFSDGNVMNVFRLDPTEECLLKDSSHNCRFRAKVVEIYEDSLLVEPLEKEEYFDGAAQVVIRLNGRSRDDYRLGCIVEVIYDSQLEESMPPIIPNARSIINLDLLSSFLPDPQYSFNATVTEVLDDCIIIKYRHFPLHNFEFSFYQVNIDPDGYAPGDTVNISYDGTVTEADPYDILGEIYRITIVDNENAALYDPIYVPELEEAYPQFFGLDTFKGLEVYVWYNGDWRCGVRSGTNRAATQEEFWAFGGGATLEEMAVILSTYGITQDEVTIGYRYDPAFSGPAVKQPTTEEDRHIHQTLLSYLPRRLATEPYIAPEFQVQKQYPLIIYAYKLAENNWRFQFYENTTIFESMQDARMRLDGLTMQEAWEKMAQYDYPPEEIPVIPISSYLSSYYYEINEQTAIGARYLLGLLEASVSDEPEPTETEPTIEVEPEPTETEPVTENTQPDTYRLVVAGKDITQMTHFTVSEYPQYVALPLIAVAQRYGARIDWNDNSTATLTVNGERYILDIANASLIKEGSNFDYILPAPGSTLYTETMGKELLIDSLNLRYVLQFIGINVKINVSLENKVITVD